MSKEFAQAFVNLMDAQLQHDLTRVGRTISRDLYIKFMDVAAELFGQDFCVEAEPSTSDVIGHARWTDQYNKTIRIRKKAQKWVETVSQSFVTVLLQIPSLPEGPFQYDIPTTQKMVDALTCYYVAETDPDFFSKFRRQLTRKVEKDKPPTEILKGTPLYPFFPVESSFGIPLRSFHEHGFLFGKSGWGKSQTMRTIFSNLIQEDCAIFLIDGNGGLIENVDKIAAIKDRVVVIDPKDKPALNFFHMQGGSRESQMELFFYLFKAIDQSLTPRQATMIAYLVDLMQAIPSATLDTLRHICETKSFPSEYLPLLPPITQDFFTNQFMGKDQLVNQTKNQIAQRLYTICRNTAFADMFNAPENKFNALQLMQERKIVVVDASREQLGDQGSAIFQRYILAQCLAAAFQRPKNARHLALIILDEAKTSLDDQSQKILSDARAFGLGLLLCSQFPDQLEDGVRKEVINNTSIKLAGPASFSVVSQLCRDMRTDADFILSMKKKDYHHTEWACYIDNLTPQAVKITVPFGAIEKLPQLSDAEHQALRARNRERYATQKPPLRTAPTSSLGAAPPSGEGGTPIIPPATTDRTVNKPEPTNTKKKQPEKSINLDLDPDL